MQSNSTIVTLIDRLGDWFFSVGWKLALLAAGLVLVAAVVVYGLLWDSIAFPPAAELRITPPAAPVGPDRYTAISVCHEQMLLLLRSPSEAKFPRSSEARVDFPNDNEVLVRDYVDAPNAFGTPVRTNFRCEVHVAPGTGLHQIVDFQVLD